MGSKKGGRASDQIQYIDRKSSHPVYEQIAESLRQKIIAGEFHPGEKLPSETRLVEMYQVSPMTVRRAIDLLLSQDVIDTVRGSGTYVKEVELGAAVFYLQDFKNLFKDDANTTIKLLEARFCLADKRIARKLRISEGERAIYIRRLLLIDDNPAFYHRGYLINDPNRPIIEAELEVTDLKGIFQGSGSSLVKYGDLHLESTMLDEQETNILKLSPPSPGMMLEHVFFDFDNKPLSWGWFVCASERLRLHTRVGIE
ncbi:MAG: GntR family transcriptional regulator [Anaerolineaceae bacterium]|nr:GntR family transcriptional regulator [Anaerolineaceae bacterium]